MAKKHAVLADLAEIREYLRDVQRSLGLLRPDMYSAVVPVSVVDDFNRVAKHLGADDGWMVDGVGSIVGKAAERETY